MKSHTFLKQLRVFAFTVLCLMSVRSSAEVIHDEQTWVNVHTWINLNEKWDLYGEYQPRYMDNRKYLSAYLLRGMLLRKFDHGLSAGLGYGFIEFDNYPNPRLIHEDRFWLQLGHGMNVGKLAINNRTRFEQRNFRHDDMPAYRFRHMLKGSYALSDSWRAVVWDEWFWNANDLAPSARSHQGAIAEGFDQNRFFVGPGYAFGEKKQHVIELGYMYQYINGITVDRGNNIIAATVILKF